jgi:aladin
MYVWNTASEVKVPLKRIGGGEVHLISWSPQGTAVLASTTSTIFRIWSTKNWTPERWNVLGGHINNACWSPCGTTVLFTTSEDAQIFCLRLTTSVDGDIESAGAAVPVMDLAKTVFTMDENQEEVSVGGRVLGMRWDPSGERLVLSFVESNLIALFCTKVTPTGLSISPLGFIPGEAGEAPTAMEFAKHFKGGALLSIAWTSGRLQHMPMFFVSNAGQEVDLASNVRLLSSSPTGPEFAPRIFSSPAF